MSTSRWFERATRWVYRARYLSTTAGPPNGGCEYTTQSVAYSPRSLPQSGAHWHAPGAGGVKTTSKFAGTDIVTVLKSFTPGK